MSSMQQGEEAEAGVGRRTRAQLKRQSLPQSQSSEGVADRKQKTPPASRGARATPKSTKAKGDPKSAQTPSTPQKKSRKSTLPDIPENTPSKSRARSIGKTVECSQDVEKTETEPAKPKRTCNRKSKAKEEKEAETVVEDEVCIAKSQDSFSNSSLKRRSKIALPSENQGTVENSEMALVAREKGGKTKKRKSGAPLLLQKQAEASPKRAKNNTAVGEEPEQEEGGTGATRGRQRRKSAAANAGKTAGKVSNSMPVSNSKRKDVEMSEADEWRDFADGPVDSAKKETNKCGKSPGERRKPEREQDNANSKTPKKKSKKSTTEEANVEMEDNFVQKENAGDNVPMEDCLEGGSQDLQEPGDGFDEYVKDESQPNKVELENNGDGSAVPEKLVGSAKRKNKQNKQFIIREEAEGVYTGEEYERSPKKKKNKKGNVITREEEDKEEMECQDESAMLQEEGDAEDREGHLDPEAFNRTLSEEISLLKPRAFLSSSFLRQAIEADGSGAEADSDAECRKAIMESAQRRIEQSLSTSESDSRLLQRSRPPAPTPGSESDSAPEAVSFAVGRQNVLDARRSESEHVQRERQKAKERRRARLEMLKQQKEEKLIRLKEKRASQEDASCSSSEESGYEEEARNARLKKKKVRAQLPQSGKENLAASSAGPAGGTQTYSGGESADSSDKEDAGKDKVTPVQDKLLKLSVTTSKRGQDWQVNPAQKAKPTFPFKIDSSGRAVFVDDEDHVSDEEPELKPETDLKTEKKSKFETLDPVQSRLAHLAMSTVVPLAKGEKPTYGGMDFIPLKVKGAKTNFKVVPLDQAGHMPTTLSQRPEDFRRAALFGSHHREPAKISLAYQQKLKAAGKDRHVR